MWKIIDYAGKTPESGIPDFGNGKICLFIAQEMEKLYHSETIIPNLLFFNKVTEKKKSNWIFSHLLSSAAAFVTSLGIAVAETWNEKVCDIKLPKFQFKIICCFLLFRYEYHRRCEGGKTFSSLGNKLVALSLTTRVVKQKFFPA